jgi:hypothetical protein
MLGLGGKKRGPDSNGFWASKEARVAVISGSFALIGALVAGVATIKKSGAGTPANATPIVVQNQIQPAPISPAPQTPNPADAMKLELEQFAMSPSDSIYEKCPADECLDAEPEWRQGNDLYFAKNHTLDDASARAMREHPSKDPEERREEVRYLSNPSHFHASLAPVFDVVIKNLGTQGAILTDIEAYATEANEEQGDGDDPTDSKVIPVLQRYTLELAPKYPYHPDKPYVVRTPAIPPLSIPANGLARFQVGINCVGEDTLTHYELQLRFRFGPHIIVKTERFRLVC